MILSNKKLANPFVYQGYESPEYFCDREVETKTLLSHLKNGRNHFLCFSNKKAYLCTHHT